MIKNIELINSTIQKLGVSNKGDLIKSSLDKDINSSAVEAEFKRKQEASLNRFNKAREAWNKEKEIYEKSEKVNAKFALEKVIKNISQKLEALGF